MILSPSHYRHHAEKKAEEALFKIIGPVQSTIIRYYEDYVKPLLLPDLLGKTLRVSERQLPAVYTIARECADILGLGDVPIFVYEDFYYGADTEGLENDPWIEISAKTLTDFTNEELQFLIGRQMAHVHCRHLTTEVLMEQSLELSDVLHRVPGINLANTVGGITAYQKTLKLVTARWSRLSNYSADACGYLICGDLEVSVRTILKTILNSTVLASNVDLKEYIGQADSIDALDDLMSEYSKLDEMVPYGPYRIKELIRYASSRPGKDALSLIKSTSSTRR